MIRKTYSLLLISLFLSSNAYCPTSPSYVEQFREYGNSAMSTAGNVLRNVPRPAFLLSTVGFLRSLSIMGAKNARDIFTKTIFHTFFVAVSIFVDFVLWGRNVYAVQKKEKGKLREMHLSFFKHLTFKYGIPIFIAHQINHLLIKKVVGLADKPGLLEWWLDPNRELRLIIDIAALLMSVAVGKSAEWCFDKISTVIPPRFSALKKKISSWFWRPGLP